MKQSTALLHVRTLANFSIAATVCVVLATTLFPYDFTTQTYEHQLAPFLNPKMVSFRSIEEDVVVNIILFAPIGFAFSILTSRRKFPGLRAFFFVVIGGALLSLLIEVLQLFLPSRHSSLFDVASNTVGAVAGFALHRLFARFVREFLARRFSHDAEQRSTSWLAAGHFLYLAFFLLISIPLQKRAIVAQLDDSSSPLLLGNEATGDRPWIGSFENLAIADYAFSRDDVQNYLGGGEPRRPLAFYSLQGTAPYYDRSGSNMPLEWSRTDTVETRGARTTTNRWLRTAMPVANISQRIAETKQFTLCVRVSSMANDQIEYARIVSVSSDVYHRNFSIVRIGDGIGIRFKSRSTGVNGTNPQFVIPQVFNDAFMHNVVVVLNGSFLSVYIDNVEQIFEMNLGPGFALFNRFIPSNGRLNIASATKHFHNFLFTAIMFMPLTYLSVLIIRQLKAGVTAKIVTSCAAVVLPPLLLESVLHQVAQRAFEWHNMLVPFGLTACTATLVILASAGKRGTNSMKRR